MYDLDCPVFWSKSGIRPLRGRYPEKIQQKTMRVLKREGMIEESKESQFVMELTEAGREAAAAINDSDLFPAPKFKITAETIYREIIIPHFPKPEWFLAKEVAIPGEGLAERRRIDAFAMKVGWVVTRQRIAPPPPPFPTNHLDRIVLEIKVDRQDWLNEIRNEYKRVAGMELATQFYFIMPSGIYRPGELPDGCGLLEIYDHRKIKVTEQAPYILKGERRMDPAVVAAILRAAQK